MPVGLPRCLLVYRLLAQPATVKQLAALVGSHPSTVHAWLTSLKDCGLAEPHGWQPKGTGKAARGLHSVLWRRVERGRQPPSPWTRAHQGDWHRNQIQ